MKHNLAMALTLAPLFAYATDVRIGGKVINKGGAPVAGCRITLAHEPALTGSTGSDGAFLISGTTGLRGLLIRSAAAISPSGETGIDALGRSWVPGFSSVPIFQSAYRISPTASEGASEGGAAAKSAAAAPSGDTVLIACAEYPDRKIAIAGYSAEMGNLKVSKPNIVYIMADDLGWHELNTYGNTFTETPNLNRLASQGVRFTNAYASAPVCSPTRGSLMTGQYPARVGILDFLPAKTPIHLDTAHVTMAERLRDAGYKTGMIGKWHLTGYASEGQIEIGPDKHGFQEVISTEETYIGGGDYWFPYFWNPALKKILPDSEYQVDRFNAQAVDYIARHKDETFFLYLAHMAVHEGLDGKPALVAKYAAKPGANATTNTPKMAAMVESVDQGVGMILDTLKALGLDSNTLVIFNSDNGGVLDVGDNGPLREGKAWLYEGGIREPLLAQWKGVIPANAVCDAPVITADMYPTLLEAGKTARDPKQVFDGASFFPQLKDAKAPMPARNLYWHYPLAKPGGHNAPSAGAMRQGNWKLIQFFVEGKQELYNLKDDPGEAKDLATTNPAKLKELNGLMGQWRTGLKAFMYPGQRGP